MKKVKEAGSAAAKLDTALTTGKDVASNASLGALATQLPKVPGIMKKVGQKALPGLNVAYQGLDAAKRFKAGDAIGGTIASASMHPALAIPGSAVQAVRDKINTGSFFPDDEEVAAGAKKSQQYWKDNASTFDPSQMPESKVMKPNRLQIAIIKEELELKKCSLSEEDLRNTLFIYKDRQGNLFTESGKQIDQNRLNEAPDLGSIARGLKTGWNAVKTTVPPAYRAAKSAIGAASDEIGDVYQGVKKVATAVGNEIVDVPASAATKVKGAYQNWRYGTTPSMDPAQRLAHISDYKSRAAMADLDAAEVARQKGLGKADVQVRKAEAGKIGAEADAIKRQGKAAADVQRATARDIESKRPMDWKPAKKLGIGAGVVGGVDAATGGVDLETDPETGQATGSWSYQPGRGISNMLPENLLDEVSLWDYMFGKGDKDKPKPRPPVKPDNPPAPVPVPPAPVKPDAVEPVTPVKPDNPPAPVKPDAGYEVGPEGPARVPGQFDVQPKPDNPPAPKPGSDKVRAMQQKLRAAGYDLGNYGPEGDGVDGKWGKKTQAAYDAYKADQNLKRAAEPDAASRERERIAAQSNAQQAPQGSDSTTTGGSFATAEPAGSSVKMEPGEVRYNPDYAKSQNIDIDPINDVIKSKSAPKSSSDSSSADPASTDYDQRAARAMASSSANKVVAESVNTELNDILWLAGRHKR